MAEGIEVREMGETHGVGTYTVKSFRVGDVLLQEPPLVFAQYLASRRGPRGIVCCSGCGVILSELWGECERLACLAQLATRRQEEEEELLCLGVDNNNEARVVDNPDRATEDYWDVIQTPGALYDALKEFDTSKHFPRGIAALDNADEASARFCCEECREQSLGKGGGRFLCMQAQSKGTLADDHELHRPSADTIMRRATNLDVKTMNLVWPSKTYILKTLYHLADTFNERLHLILSLLARCLNDTLTVGETVTNALRVRERFSATVHNLIARYAEGASRSLTEQQRSFMRFSWKCVCHWLSLCCTEKGAGGEKQEDDMVLFQWFPLQLYLRCFWLADANVHMFVVVSPIYSLLCQQLPVLQAICRQNGEVGVWSANRVRRQVGILRQLFRVVDPCAAHATGVALYDVATKINHSCVPSVRFVPTHGSVRAIVVALRDINAGEEIRSSYIDLAAHTSKVERRDYLLAHYGFNCDCPLCSDE